MQLMREFTANKSKQNQMNPSKKACISLDSLGGIGAFQGVTTNPNKKISRPRSRSYAGCTERASSPSFASNRHQHDPAREKLVSHYSTFCNTIATGNG
jgi:hypothetical protein